MEDKIKEIKADVIKDQKDAVIKEIAVAKMHLGFHNKRFDDMEVPKSKEGKEQLAHQKLQTVNPLMDNIEIKTKYYEFLCSQE